MTTIEVFADVRCPFTHVGIRRFLERRDAAGGGPTLIVRAWPLELVNDAPMDPDKIGEEIDAIRDQVAPDLFTAFTPARFAATSLPALELAAIAAEQSPELGEALAVELRWAHFEEGRDIGDPGDYGRQPHPLAVRPITEQVAAITLPPPESGGKPVR